MKAEAIRIVWGFDRELGRGEVGDGDGFDDFVHTAH
jgi:hypothetical protein